MQSYFQPLNIFNDRDVLDVEVCKMYQGMRSGEKQKGGERLA